MFISSRLFFLASIKSRNLEFTLKIISICGWIEKSRWMWFFCTLLCIYLVPAWVCNVSAGTDPPKCSLSLSHTDFLRTKLTIMLHFHFRPTVFKVDVLIISPWEKCHVELVICLMISIYETTELHSPLVPSVRCVHQNWWSGSQRRMGVSQPGGALCDGFIYLLCTDVLVIEQSESVYIFHFPPPRPSWALASDCLRRLETVTF